MYASHCILSSVQLLSHVWPFATLWIAARQASLSITNSQSSDSHPLSQWCHPAVSSFVMLFSSRLQSFPASGSFLMSQLFTSGGQSIKASASVLPMNIQGWLYLWLIVWYDLLAVQGTLKSLLQHHSSKPSVLWCSASLQSNSHIHTWLLEKPWFWLYGPLLAK